MSETDTRAGTLVEDPRMPESGSGGVSELRDEEARADFLSKYPDGFSDPSYLGDKKRGERVYKWRAHEHFVETLGEGQLERLLQQGEIEELGRRAQQVVNRVNILARTEAAAFPRGCRIRLRPRPTSAGSRIS